MYLNSLILVWVNCFLKIKSKNYYALDIDKKALQYGKAHGIKNTLNLRIDNHLPKKLQNNFDIVLATEVIEHQIDPQKFFTNIFKLLNSDGLLIITAPNKDRIFSRKREFPTDIPPHHFLKLSQKFFKKNFNLLYIKTFNDLDAGYKKTAKTISILLFKNKKYWLICIPIVPLAKIFRKVSKNHGTRLLVVIKKP